jgi:hypothetical protein
MGHLELSLPSPNRSTRAMKFPLHLPTVSKRAMAKTSPRYQSMFDRALECYEKKTGKDLTSVPLFRKFEACNGSPGNAIALLREQFSGLNRSGGDSEKLANWLNLTVNTVNAFSGIIGASVSLVCLTLSELV